MARQTLWERRNLIKRVFVDHHSGSRLQLIAPRERSAISIAKRDHRPVCVAGDVALQCNPKKNSHTIRWDLAKLSHATQFGDARTDLFRDPETEFSDWKSISPKKPDIPMGIFTDAVHRVGAKYFTDLGDNRLPTSRAIAREDWRTTNRVRQQLRVAIQRIPEELQPDWEEDREEAKRQCRDAGKSLRRIARTERAQTRDALEALMWEAWSKRDSREVWKIARCLTGKKGP